MNIAVMTLTRDRLDYTKHCFQTLEEHAGCDYDHFVLDQGSVDGTPAWLIEETGVTVAVIDRNIGCCRGWNMLLEKAFDPADYDVIVCFDNDCELIVPDTLRVVAGLAAEHNTILSPRVLGLRNPPPTVDTFRLGDRTVDETTILGNIFMAIPASLIVEDGFRWDETFPVWAGGESVTAWHRARGGRCGYVEGFAVNHYETTDGQHTRYPEYFARRVGEGGPE